MRAFVVIVAYAVFIVNKEGSILCLRMFNQGFS